MDTQELLDYPHDPLVAINGIKVHDPCEAARSMGFIIEKLPNKLRLIATVRHGFDNVPRHHQILKSDFMNRVVNLELVGRLDDTLPESDIAFLLAKDPTDCDSKPFVLEPSDPLMPVGPHILFNVANRCEHTRGRFSLDVTRQLAQECDELCFCRLDERTPKSCLVKDTKKIERFSSEGRQCCRSFMMQSRPGNSGSPVWDEELELVGMNIRGGSNSSGTDFMVLIPRGELYLARQRIIPRLNKLLVRNNFPAAS